MILSEGEMVPLNPFIVPRVIKIFGEIPSENPKCILVGDVSRSSVLVLHDFAEQNHRKKFKNYIVKVFICLYFLGIYSNKDQLWHATFNDKIVYKVKSHFNG